MNKKAFLFSLLQNSFDRLPNIFCNNLVPFCSWMNTILLIQTGFPTNASQ